MQVVKNITASILMNSSKTNVNMNYGLLNKTTRYGAFLDNDSSQDGYVNLLNRIILDFLQNDCGVENLRIIPTSEDPTHMYSLVIFGVPINFFVSCYRNTSNNQVSSVYSVCMPFKNAYEQSAPPANDVILSNNLSNIQSDTTQCNLNLNFKLCFTGNPKSAFVLRVVPYNKTVTSNIQLFVAKSKNVLLNNSPSVCYGYSPTSSGAMNTVYYGDLTDDINSPGNQILDGNVFQDTSKRMSPVFETNEFDVELVDHKLPLIHETVHTHTLDSVYLTPRNFGLPQPAVNNSVSQIEFKIGDRKFINTANTDGNINSNLVIAPIGVGMIDVSNDPLPEAGTTELTT